MVCEYLISTCRGCGRLTCNALPGRIAVKDKMLCDNPFDFGNTGEVCYRFESRQSEETEALESRLGSIRKNWSEYESQRSSSEQT